MAQVAGGAFATLVTVVVFAVGLLSQRSDGGATYLPFTARRYHVFFVAAAVAAIATVNAVGPVVVDIVGPVAIKYLLLANIVAVPAIVLATLALMCKVIEGASGTDLESTRPVFRSTMRHIAAFDTEQSDTANAFVDYLSRSRMQVNAFAGMSSRHKARDGRFLGAMPQELVVDVDMVVLRKIEKIIRPFEDRLEISLLAAPTLRGGKPGVMHLSLLASKPVSIRREDGLAGAATQVITDPDPVTLEQLLGDAVLGELSALVSRLFICGVRPAPDADLRHFFSRTQADFERLAHAGDSVLLKSRLGHYRVIVREWLAVAGPSSSIAKLRVLALREPRFFGPLEIDFADVLRAAKNSKDFETYTVVCDAISRMLFDADQSGATVLFADAASLLSFAFYLGMEESAFRKQLGDLFDGRVDSMVMGRTSLRELYRDDEDCGEQNGDSDEAEKRYAVIRSILSMIRRSIEAGEKQTAQRLIDRLTRHTGGPRSRVHAGEHAPSTDSGSSLIQYGLVAVIGWCYQLMEANHAESEVARSVMTYAFASVPARHELVGMWELYHGLSSSTMDIDERVQVSHWTLGDADRRVGITYTSSGADSWLNPGFWIAMLSARQPYRHELKDYFSAPPSQWLWKTETLDGQLSGLQESLSFGTADENELARNEVIELIKLRKRVGDAAVLREIAALPLSPARIEQFRTEIREGIVNYRENVDVLLGVIGPDQSATIAPDPCVMRAGIPRDCFAPNGTYGGGIGNMIAEDLARGEWRQLVYQLAKGLEESVGRYVLADAAASLRIAVDAIVARGYSPDLIIVPAEERFAAALFRRPLWQLNDGKGHEWGRARIGEWENIVVIRCPYPEFASIIVADTRKLFGRILPISEVPGIDIDDSSDGERQAFLARVTDEGTDALPDAEDISVRCTVTIPPVVGYADMNAACRLDVRGGDACFAMEPADDLYHRPDCMEISGAGDLRFSLSKRADGETVDRKPCETCRPQVWNVEARLGTLPRVPRSSSDASDAS